MRNRTISCGTMRKHWCRSVHCVVTVALIMLLCGAQAAAYSVLTHEEIVDLLWTSEIRQMLLNRYPDLTEDQLTQAHAYAYGGAVIQDLGYYPFGSREFSNLVHYVRSGDFVRELLIESSDANEYAFALGALSHYAADVTGHPAVNQAVAIEYPKLQAKYGKSVRYAQDKTAHLKTEFGFDTLQVSRNRYASQQYHDFIGFQVSKPLLERVFPAVYGLELKDVLTHEDLAVGSYRYAVSHLIPHMTEVALQTHKKDMLHETPDLAKRKFLYRLSRSGYEKEWGKDYVKPGVGTRVLSSLLRYVPKYGPFKGLDFKSPTPQTEDLYIKSINATVDQYRNYLVQEKTGKLQLRNLDLDTGNATVAGEYSLADDTYAELLVKLSGREIAEAPLELRTNILQYYGNLKTPALTRKTQRKWMLLQDALKQLKSTEPTLQPVAIITP